MEHTKNHRRRRSMCDMHYNAWRKSGTTTACPKPKGKYKQHVQEGDCHCGRKVFSRNLCRRHYLEEVYADTPPPTRDALADNVYPYIDKLDNGCWEWQRARVKYGYGTLGYVEHGRIKTVGVHRWVWEDMVGPIPKEMTLDHLCRNPPCCNPAHLEVVTRQENSRRAAAARREEDLTGRLLT